MDHQFDLRTEIRDPKTGRLQIHQPYTLHISSDGTYYERPPGSQNMYDPTGKLVKGPEFDRLEAEKKAAVDAAAKGAAKVEKKG